MDSLEKEILKYEKKGYKVVQKRSLKYGSRIFLVKKGGWLGSDECVYIYNVNGDCTVDSLRECFKDYIRFYEEHDFDSSDKGLVLCSGSFDEKLFRDVRKAMISDDDIRNSIKPIITEKGAVEKEVVKESKETKEREIETPQFASIVEKIKRFTIHKIPKTEKDLDSMLVHFLSAFYPDIQTQVAYQNTKIDAQIGNVGIEIKFQPSAGEFDRLYGQTEKYLKSLEKVIVVIGYERTRELTENFEKRMKERGWLNNKVFVVAIK
jgi:hypothetical protein